MKYLLPALALLTLALSSCKVKDYPSDARPVSHALWDSLLQAHVTPDGWVDYEGFIADSSRLQDYLTLLSNHHPNTRHWSRAERKAYWINAYNAFTVKLIVDHYPVPGIKEIKKGIPFVNTVWDIKFIRIEDATYDLNNIEHGILRPKFKDPRIHFAVNCASVSCPPLSNRAYVAERLDAQLDEAARRFLADERRNIVTPDTLKLSKIFSWYAMDFPKPIQQYVNQFTPLEVRPDAKVEHLGYDWNLNGVKENGG